MPKIKGVKSLLLTNNNPPDTFSTWQDHYVYNTKAHCIMCHVVATREKKSLKMTLIGRFSVNY